MKTIETHEIMVVERDLLLGEKTFQGFLPADRFDYESIILKNYHYAPRRAAELDPGLKQPIAYCMIVNPSAGSIFAYRRACGENDYAEERLRGKWSIGIGGHIDRADLSAENPILASMIRELTEEIAWEGPAEPRLLGYLNDELDMVGKVHFGLLYRLEASVGAITPRSREIAESRMVATSEWGKMMREPEQQIEGWTRIASGPLLRSLAV